MCADDDERELALEVDWCSVQPNTFSCASKVLGSRGEAEKERELEAAAEKERLKAAAKAGALFCV
jgi:hypothetical protein